MTVFHLPWPCDRKVLPQSALETDLGWWPARSAAVAHLESFQKQEQLEAA